MEKEKKKENKNIIKLKVYLSKYDPVKEVKDEIKKDNN